jgi:hypothetical protein
MKKLFNVRFFIIALVGLVTVAAAGLYQFNAVATYFNNDPDIPDFVKKAKSQMSKEEYRHRRAEQVDQYRGMADGDRGEKLRIRNQEIAKMEQQIDELRAKPASAQRDSLLAAWVPIGPDPIPNGQVKAGPQTPVSGRVTAIDVHPTNPNIAYVGTAMGGLYRTLDGGLTWTQLMQDALSLAIGAVRIAPSQPETVYVGTGEPNFSTDSYYGVGIYRIDNASTTAVKTGPIGNANFNARSISEILVHPTDPATIFVSSASACASLNCGAAPPAVVPAQNRGVWRSTNATSANPTFAQLPYPFANQNLSARDIVLDPQNPNLLVAWVVANGGGVLVSNNAMNADPATVTFVQRVTASGTATSDVNGELSISRPAGAPQPTIYVATGVAGGTVLRSDDGGVTFPLQIDNNFCTPQCFYDIAVEADPVTPTRVYLGGAPTLTMGVSVTGGTAFVESSAGGQGVHVDSHAIAVSPSSPNIVYFGSDGGIYRSDDFGATLVQRNTAGFLATQFMGIDNHPTDPNILIGGTQDNGTNRFTTVREWIRTDFGDGGYSVIDQSSTDNVIYNQYHTYFNASNLTGYAYSNNGAATEGTWTFRGCNNTTTANPRNGIFCTTVINFYAPLERGPGTPNTIYYGSDRLYRSADTGVNHDIVSQTFTSPVSAIGVSPQNDLVRIIGLNNGGIFGTTTGANPLLDLDPANEVPAAYVTRAVIHPNDQNTAFVTLARFNAPQVYRTNNLSSFAAEGLIAPTWSAINGTGLPLVPVNAFFVDPASNFLYAGTDIGVYVSVNGGTSWAPLGTGFPRIAVFDLEDAPGGILRAATHGQGIYETTLLAPTAASVTVSGRVTANGRGVANAIVTYAGETGERKSAITNAFGYYRFEEVPAGQSYVFNVVSKRYTFPSRAVTVSEELSELNFEAE